MKPVYIHAYLEGNFGDDLMVQLLCRRYPRTQFCTFSTEDNRSRFADLKNLKVYVASDPEVMKQEEKARKKGISNGFLRYLLKNCEAAVHIGGSSFIQHYDDYSAFLAFDRFLAENSRRMYLMGANFGPYTDEQYYRDYHELFKCYTGITFRDETSFRLFQDLPNVKCALDVVLSRKTLLLGEKERMVTIVPVDISRKTGKYDISGYTDAYIDWHVRMIRAFAKEGYTSIRMLCFCPNQGDGAIMQRIIDALTPEERTRLFCVAYDGRNESDIYYSFEHSECVVATRFHSVILGFLHKCKVLPVIYDPKTRNELLDLSFDGGAELSDLASMDAEAAVRQLLAQTPLDPLTLRKSGEQAFAYVDELLMPAKFYV